MFTRRQFIKGAGWVTLSGAALAGYAFVIEPGFLLFTEHHSLTRANSTPGLKLRLVMLADPHLVEPHMPLSRWPTPGRAISSC